MSRANLLTLLLWLCAFALLTWVLRDLPVAQMWSALLALSAWQWSLWFLLNAAVVALSTARWRVLGNAMAACYGFMELVLIRLAGQTVSFLTPGPQFGGEPLQVYWLYKRHTQPLHKAVLSLALDRFFELWVNFAVLLLGALCLLLSPSMAFTDWTRVVLILLALVLALPWLFLRILRSPERLLTRLQSVFAKWLSHPLISKLNAHGENVESDLRNILKEQRGALLQAFLFSVLTWGLILAELAFLLWVLDIHVSITGFILLAVAIRLAMLMPLPGGIGTIEAALLWCFSILGLSLEAALALIVLMRLRDVVILLAGAASLFLIRRKPA